MKGLINFILSHPVYIIIGTIVVLFLAAITFGLPVELFFDFFKPFIPK